MDTISVLKARVMIDGLADANAKLAAFDASLHSVAGTAGTAGGDLDKVSTAARDVDRDLAKARTTIAGTDADIRRARQSVRGLGDDFNAQRQATNDARVGVDAIGGSLQGFGTDLQRAHEAINDSRGGLQSLRSDLDRARDAAVVAGAGIKQAGTDGADGVRGLGDESRRTTSDVEGLSSGLDRARKIVADANAQFAKTGTVSSSLQSDLRNLASRGVDGLDKDMDKLRSTLAKAESELGSTGSLSRRTMRDLEDLGGGAGGAGGGLGSLASALDGLPGGIGAVGAAVAFLLPLLFALGGSTIAVVAALGPLVGLAGAAAVGLTAAAQGFGVFKLATSGVAAALREQTTNQDAVGRSAITSANQQRAAARAIQSAMEGVRTAHEQVTSATEHLAAVQQQARTAELALTQARIDARRALIDMRLSLNEATDSEQAAILALKDARQAYADLLAGPGPEDLAKAQQSVTEASHNQEQAAIDLTRAQQNYAAVMGSATSSDLEKHQALVDLEKAQDGVRDSAFALADAQDALKRLEQGPSDEDKRKALLAIREAQDSLTRSTVDRKRQQEDANSADRAGVAGSPQVVAALDAIRKIQQEVTDAHRQLADAERGVTRATQAVRDAQLNASSSALGAALSTGRLNRAMEALPAPARAFVRELIALRPLLADLRATAAAGFFPGARAGLLDAAQSFEPVKTVVGATARVLGTLTQKAGEMVGSKAWGSDIATVGARNASIIGTLGDAALHVVDALRNVIVAAGPLTSWLARVADGWAKNVDQAAAAGRENGKLAGFFDRTRKVLRLVGDILVNVGGGLLGIGKAGTRSGNDILRSIDRAARRFDEWANSTKGQSSIKKFFQDSTDLLKNLGPVLAGVGRATANIGFGPMALALKLAGPYAEQLTYAFLGFKAFSGLAGIITGIAGAMTALTGAETAAGAATIILDGALAVLLSPITAIVLAIAALVGGLVLAYKHVRWFHDAVDATFGWIKDHWPLLLGIITGPIGTAAVLIVQHWDTIKKGTTDAWDAVKTAITTPIRAVADWLENTAWPSIRDTASRAWRELGDTAVTAWDGVKTAVTTPIRAVASWLSDTAWPSISGAASTGWNAIETAITSPIGDAIREVKSLIGHGGRDSSGLVGWLSDSWDNIVAGIAGPRGFGARIVSGITDAFRGAVKAVANFINLIIKAINLIPGVPDIKPIDTRGLAVGGSFSAAGVEHYATGGQVRRGTRITKPMIMMGEEAPQHPEFVIPTNPAYRDRAHMLLGEAAKATGFMAGGLMGFATGGMFVSTAYGPPWNSMEGGGTTSTGIRLPGGPTGMAGPYIVAVDPAVIPYHTQLNIQPNPFDWLGTFAAEDTGGAIRGNRIDFLDMISRTHQDWWGVRDVTVSAAPGGSRSGGGGGILGTIGGAISGAAGAIAGIPGDLLSQGASWILDQLPKPADVLPAWLVGTGSYVLDHVTGWIKQQVESILPGLGGGGSPGGTQGPIGLGTFDGLQVAKWIIPELAYGRAHGWGGPITSGYRGGVDSHTADGNSEHRGTQYPHGAVDFGGMVDAAGLANKLAFMRAVAGYRGLRLLAAQGFRDDGHMSGTGHAIGGIISAAGTLGGLPFGGFFDQGGVVPGPTGAPVAIVAHGGETVTPAGAGSSPVLARLADALENLKDGIGVEVYMDGREITDRVDVRLRERDRRSGGAYFAGRRA